VLGGLHVPAQQGCGPFGGDAHEGLSMVGSPPWHV
jgi:hypothetical protein